MFIQAYLIKTPHVKRGQIRDSWAKFHWLSTVGQLSANCSDA